MAITDVSKIIKYNPENIPQSLKDNNFWIVWKTVEKTNDKGKQVWTKVLYDVRTGARAKTNDPKTWYNHEYVINHKDINKYDGLGIVLSNSDVYAVLDLDGILDANTGDYISHEQAVQNDDTDKPKDLTKAIELSKQFRDITYCEISPSGTGEHIFFTGKIPENARKKIDALGMELYSTKRFMTMTGKMSGQNEIVSDEVWLQDLAKDYFIPEDEHEEKTGDYIEPNLQRYELTDDEVINVIEHSTNGEKIMDILHNDWKKYFPASDGSSEAVQSVLWNLAFYTGKDVEQMNRIFMKYNNEYGLTKKWTEKRSDTTWGALEIEKAIKGTKEVYQPQNIKFTGEATTKEIKERLQHIGVKLREEALQKWEADGKQGRKPTSINPLTCARTLSKLFTFIAFDSGVQDEEPRLLVYLANEGLYSPSRYKIQQLIGYLEPLHDERQSEKVMYYIKRDTEVTKITQTPTLIPVNNGIYNVETKELEPFSDKYIFLSKIATNYNPHVTAPVIDGWNFDDWLSSIACDDEQVVKLLWEVINDALNSNYSRKRAIFLVGTGNNGKGTFQALINNLIGANNVASLKIHQFNQRFSLSQIEGKACIIGDDNPVGEFIEYCDDFKSIVTGDQFTIEVKNKTPYKSEFHGAVIQSTNGIPRFKDKTDSLYRRFVIVNFDADFNGEVENRKIKDEYIKNEQVLEYVLKQALEMNFEFFTVPDSSKQALEEFKIDNDPLLQFKTEVFDDLYSHKCISVVPTSVVYELYCRFCESDNINVMGKNKFTKDFGQLLGKSFKKDKRRIDFETLNQSFEEIGQYSYMLRKYLEEGESKPQNSFIKL